MSKKEFLTLTLLFLLSNFAFSQINKSKYLGEPGKCYAKVLFENEYIEKEVQLPIYLGEPNETVKFETIVLQIEEESFEAMNLPTDNFFDYSRSTDLYDSIQIVDTLTSKNYVLETFFELKLVKKGRYENKEVLCGDRMNRRIIRNLQKKLLELGYENIETTGKMNLNTKLALKEYQKDHDLAIGQITIETLNNLEVDW